MKKLLLSLMAVLSMSSTAFALDNIVLDNFENGLVNFTTEVHVNPPASMDIAVVDNPFKTGINTSNKVWEWKRFDATPDVNQSWAGFWSVLTNPIPAGYHRIEIKFLRTNATSQLKIKCEGAVTKEILPVNPATQTNVWETMVFDLNANGIKNINVFGFFPDFCDPVNPNAVCYIDDITVIYDPTIVPPVIPDIQTLFDNSASDRFYDQSWVNVTAPSTVATQNWDASSSEVGDKFPVVTSPARSGNALKLQWKSVTAGDWKAAVASPATSGWKVFDLSVATHLKFWINSPVAIAKANLPKINFEAASGTPNATGKVSLANYLTTDLVANTWTEVIVPLADLWAADATFASKEYIKSVFFSQDATDNTDHILYMDDFTFEKVTAPLSLFSNSASDRFFDQSWSYKTSPSTLTQVNWDAASSDPGDKLPCVTSPVKDGANALKLQWKSVDGGDWAALVASIGWVHFDLTNMTHLKFWVNSPETLAKAAMPKIYFQAHTGNPNTTGQLELGNYLASDLVANTWTEISVPLADFWATNTAFTSKADIKGAFFSQNATDNVEHIMYMDEFTFVKSVLNSVNSPSVVKLNAYYYNGEIRFVDYQGTVRVFDLTGKVVAKALVTDGVMKVNLQKGIYIVNTSKANVKIAVN